MGKLNSIRIAAGCVVRPNNLGGISVERESDEGNLIMGLILPREEALLLHRFIEEHVVFGDAVCKYPGCILRVDDNGLHIDGPTVPHRNLLGPLP